MSKNVVYSLVLVFVLLVFVGLAFRVKWVEASGTIYIRANGYVEGTDKITNENNVTYTFTEDINDSIVVQRSNIIIDGDGYTLTGPYTEVGFNLTDLTNVTIRNVSIVGFGYGIYLQSSTQDIISNNNITFNEGNIYLGNSSDNMITGNTMTDGAEAIQLYASSNNTISGNSMSDNYNGVWSRLNSAENVISGNNITENYNGIYLDSSSSNTISKNNVTANHYSGIYLSESSNNTVSENDISNNSRVLGGSGIMLSLSSNNVLSGNSIIANNWWGINPASSNNNTIFGNNIRNNNVGINSASSDFNIVSANNIIDNGYSGIYLESSSSNIFYHNNLINNTNQVVVEPGYANVWDGGYPSGGNYWSDYGGTDQYEGISQAIPGNDTIGDTPYEIDVDNVDRYPLMTQYGPLRPLFLESEGRWNMGEAAGLEVWSAFASDVDGDGVVEIMTCAQLNQGGELRIYGYDGLVITLEHVEMWQTDGSTRAWSVFASDVDGDGVTEILVGAEARGQVFGQLRIWNWNGTTLTLEHSEEWQTVSWTHVYSVFAADTDDDGVTEIITGGDAFNGTSYNNQLRIWNWNGTALTLESSREWCTGGGAGVQSVYVSDVDGDSTVDIVTAGQDNSVAQLRIWNWNGTTLTLEHSEEWTLTWIARALSVFASDVDGDGNIEIVTGGEAHAQFGSSWVGNGQLRVWNWNGSAIGLKDSREWPLNGTYAYIWTTCSGDVDRDGLTEIITAGASKDGAQLRVWSFNGSTLTLDASQESVDESADAVFAFDVDGDGTTEIITAGVAYEETYIYEQLRIWSFPESIPPTITIVSPENKTYSTNTIPLTFAIDEPADWVGYSLNGHPNATITGNTTLPTLLDGLHHVVVYTNDTYGNMGMSTVYFNVDTIPPIANAGDNQTVTEDTLVQFDGSASTDENSIAAYSWTFTDVTPQTLNGENPTYTFATPGTYTVTLEVADPAGNTATDTITITVLDVTAPAANAGSDRTINEDVSTTLDGSASADNVGIIGYTWTFTDVTVKTLTGDKPAYSFSNPGVYTITLNVTDAAGNWAVDTAVITVLDVTTPVANAGQDQTVNVGDAVAFDAGGSTDNVGIVRYEWDFGDGTSGTGITVTHEYTNAGTYTVTLTVEDAAGNQATDTVVVTVNSTEAFPMWIVATAGIVALGVIAAAVILWRRRK